ncbi:MAG TPA: GTP 3',8-cyclase MoaA [Thermoanaerobaculia bacterium]|nr:GTP 3',8-cyclase MoaA [Thermoanaerobaculia bacterium]
MSLDSLGRPLRDLRISVTDRCNFRCTYCMPREIYGRDFEFLPREELMTFEEIARLGQLFAQLGVEKVRLTGGEPLLRRDIESLIEMLSHVKGIRDLTMTSNGSLLTREKARALKDAGLSRISISLDSLDDDVFRAMNDVNFPVGKVLDAIDAANEAQLWPIKVDMVVKRGINENSILDMASHFRGTGHIVRFIEYMDVGTTNGWRMEEVVPSREVVERIAAQWPIEAVNPNYFGEVAERYRYRDGAGEFGIISSVTQPFCGSCTRARLTADGKLYLCLFATEGHDLLQLLRRRATDEEMVDEIRAIWRVRDDRYSEIRSSETTGLHKVEMSRIGG